MTYNRTISPVEIERASKREYKQEINDEDIAMVLSEERMELPKILLDLQDRDKLQRWMVWIVGRYGVDQARAFDILEEIHESWFKCGLRYKSAESLNKAIIYHKNKEKGETNVKILRPKLGGGSKFVTMQDTYLNFIESMQRLGPFTFEQYYDACKRMEDTAPALISPEIAAKWIWHTASDQEPEAGFIDALARIIETRSEGVQSVSIGKTGATVQKINGLGIAYGEMKGEPVVVIEKKYLAALLSYIEYVKVPEEEIKGFFHEDEGEPIQLTREQADKLRSGESVEVDGEMIYTNK